MLVDKKIESRDGGFVSTTQRDDAAAGMCNSILVDTLLVTSESLLENDVCY